MKRNLLLTPGPTKIPPEIRAVLGQPIIHHRTPQFRESLKQAVEGLKYVLRTKNDVYLLASSGTGAMEAAVVNLLSPGDNVITVDSGKFGERWGELCQIYGANVQVIKVDWGKVVDPVEIEKNLNANKTVKAVFVTFCETSTGVISDIRAIAEIVQKTDALLVVDGISGIGVADFKMDEWGVDVVVGAGHKGFMLPPGLGFISVNNKAFKQVGFSTSPRYYFDLRKYKKALVRGDTPFTPASAIVVALNESLRQIKQKGLEHLFSYYARLAKGTRAAARALGLRLLCDDSCASNVLTAICLPEGIEGGEVVRIMRDIYGISIAGGQSHLKGKIIRMAHMGCVDEYDLLAGISCLEKVLDELGYPFVFGTGLTAAQEVFNAHEKVMV